MGSLLDALEHFLLEALLYLLHIVLEYGIEEHLLEFILEGVYFPIQMFLVYLQDHLPSWNNLSSLLIL